ncbi:MAG: hypothetical protein HFH76_16215 [Lachnospiraceae bacterium]|nr:hypothetical protein [Lachnospiraceae bacterium]
MPPNDGGGGALRRYDDELLERKTVLRALPARLLPELRLLMRWPPELRDDE